MVRDSNTCQRLERLLGYHFINDACQLLHEWRKTAGLKSHLYQKVMKKKLLTLMLLHRTGIDPLSKASSVTMRPLHQRCWSTQTRTVENIMDINPSEARFFWNSQIRLDLLRHTGVKPISISKRSAVLPLHQRRSSIRTLKKDNSRVVNSSVTKITAKFLSMF